MTYTNNATPDRLIPLPVVSSIAGMSKTTIYAAIRAGTFPKPIRIGSSSRFSEREVNQWVANRIAERDAKAVA